MINNFKVKMSDNSSGRNYNRHHDTTGMGGHPPGDNPDDGDDYLQDFKEKRKLLVRW